MPDIKSFILIMYFLVGVLGVFAVIDFLNISNKRKKAKEEKAKRAEEERKETELRQAFYMTNTIVNADNICKH